MARLYGPKPGAPPTLLSTADLEGLSANDVDDSPIGELVGTLSEERTGLIRYLDISIRGADRHVLVPIGHARIDRESVPPHVRLRAASHADLLRIPAFDEDETTLDPEYQDRLLEAHGRLFYGSRYYAHPAYDHEPLHAGDRPVVPVEADAPADEPSGALRPLSELRGFRLASRAPSLTGWPVEDEAGERIGEILELLVEPRARQVRYLVVHLDDPDRATILPSGYVEVDRERERVCTPSLTEEDVRLLPAFEPPLTRQEENRLHAALQGRLSGERYFERADFRAPGAARR